MGYTSYDQTDKIVKRTSDGYWGGSMGTHGFEADVPGTIDHDHEATSPYAPGSLLQRAGEIALRLADAAGQGEEGLEPQTA